MSVQRLEAKCVELVARRYDRYASALERAGAAPQVWDALWECMVRRNLLAVGSAERWDFGPLLRHHLRPVVSQEGGEVMALDVSGDASGARAAPLTLFAWLAEQIVRACPSLNRLTVGSVADKELATLLAGLSELRGLEVESAVPITDDGLLPFFNDSSLASRLTTLRLNRNATLAGATLRRLVEACANLRELTLTHFGCMEHITSELVHTIAHAPLHTTLTSLWLNDCSLVTDEAIADVLDRCTALEVLRIGMGMQIQGECFLHLSPQNAGAKLRRLDFNNCPLPRPTFMYIASVCTNLQTLGLSNSPTPIDKEALTYLLQQCPHLKDLSATLATSDTLTCFERENQLRYLYLMLLPTEVGIGQAFDDEHVRSLALGCPRLESLDLCKVSDSALWLLTSKLPSLRTLSLYIDRASDQCRTELPTPVCLDLESLRLSCSSINGAQMHHLLSTLASSDDSADMGYRRGLKELHLTSCPNADDEVLGWVSLCCAAALRKLALYACPIGDRAMEVLARCFVLESLSFKKCDQVSPAAASRLVRLRRDSLLQVFFPQGPHFRKETLALVKDLPHLRIA